MRAQQQEVNHILTLGAALGADLGSSCRVRQGGLGRTLGWRSGFVLDDNHRDLGSLRRSLGQRPEKEWVQNEANQIQDKTTRTKNYKNTKETYSSSSSAELSAERSKSGSPPVRRGRGECPLVRLAGAVAVDREDLAPVVAAA